MSEIFVALLAFCRHSAALSAGILTSAKLTNYRIKAA